jgi:cytochrome c551/c552
VPAAGTDTFTWTPTLPAAGSYEIFARWTSAANRASDATDTIYYDGGTSQVQKVKSQQSNGGTWVSLGRYDFQGAGGEYVELAQSASGFTIADAIQWSDAPSAGIYAPNVVGDNTTYGCYVNGHNGPGMDCLSCHDASKQHIDHEHRTYASASDNYQAGYRLLAPMVVPRPPRGDIYAYLDDFELCGNCHNLYEVLGANVQDESHTNFKADAAPSRSGHTYHLALTSVHSDSDWDGTADSTQTCTTCHNVHGSTSVGPQLRHGELISTYGTTDKVPALNFSYLPAGADLWNSTGSKSAMVGNLLSQNGVCNACHSTYTLYRTPYLGPKVLTTKADPDPAPADGATDVVLTAFVLDHDDDVTSVTIDLTDIGGGSGTTMYDYGDAENSGDEVAGDGIYSYKTTIPGTVAAGEKSLFVEADDPDGPTGTNYLVMTVTKPGVVDNPDGTAVGSWPTSSSTPGYYGDDYQYHVPAAGSDTFTWTPTITTAGTYEVWARWTSAGNRASDATYTVYHDAGSTPVAKDQRSGGGTWISLGTYDFDGVGVEKVELGQSATGFTIADAIWWDLQ